MPPRGERLVSPRVAALLNAALPKFQPPAASHDVNVAGRGPAADLPAASDIVRLPTYIVRESKLPKFPEVERREIARRAMEEYLGPEDGFDRGFLNLFTSERVPILALFGSVSNEARAMARHREDERIKLKADLLEFAELTKLGGDPATAEKLKRATRDAFRRD